MILQISLSDMRRFRNLAIKRKPPLTAVCIVGRKWKNLSSAKFVLKFIAKTAAGENVSYPMQNIKTSGSAASNVTKNTSNTSTINNSTKKKVSTLQPLTNCNENTKKLKPSTIKNKHKSTNTKKKNESPKLSKAIWKKLSSKNKKDSSNWHKIFKKLWSKKPYALSKSKKGERESNLSKKTINKNKKYKNSCRTKRSSLNFSKIKEDCIRLQD